MEASQLRPNVVKNQIITVIEVDSSFLFFAAGNGIASSPVIGNC